jgi:hypothetical protein
MRFSSENGRFCILRRIHQVPSDCVLALVQVCVGIGDQVHDVRIPHVDRRISIKRQDR